MKDEEGKKQDFQTIAYQPKVWTTGAMHQHRKISAESPWNWWSLTHRDEELGSVAYHTICWEEKLYVYQSQVQWVSDAALVLGWWEKVQSFMLLISTSSYHDKIWHTSIEAYGTLLLILKANLKISVTLPLYLRDNYLYKQQ